MKIEIKDLNLLINNFYSSLDDRSAIFSVYYNSVIEKTLQWHLISWKNWLIKEKSPDYDWFMIYRTTEEGIKKIGIRSINTMQYSFTTTFMKTFKEHIEKNIDEKVQTNANKILYYRTFIYGLFFDLVIEFITKSDFNEKDYMWQEFPADWKVTKSNLKDQKVFAVMSLLEFMKWSYGRIQDNQENKPDEPLHNIVENLFPEVDSRTFEILLFFAVSPFNPENRVKSIVERNWRVGYLSSRSFGRVFSMINEKEITPEELEKQILQKQKENEERFEDEKQKTYELMLLLFPNDFSQEFLNKYLVDAENLKYGQGTIEEYKRIDLLKIFNGLQKYLSLKTQIR
jgi:hypothetical protein